MIKSMSHDPTNLIGLQRLYAKPTWWIAVSQMFPPRQTSVYTTLDTDNLFTAVKKIHFINQHTCFIFSSMLFSSS